MADGELGKHTVDLEIGFSVNEDRGEGVDSRFVEHSSHTTWFNVPREGVVAVQGATIGAMTREVLQLGADATKQ